MRWTVLIVDDHPLVAEALEAAIVHAYPQFGVARVSNAAEAESYARRHPDHIRVVMLDLMLPDTEGFGALLRLQQILPKARFAIVSSRVDAAVIAMSRAFGVQAYLSKAQSVETLVNAVGAILRGESLFPSIEEDIANTDGIHKRLLTLSAAQTRVLKAMIHGKLNKQIANDLGLTEGTVKQHVSAILKKLNVPNRSQAILAGARYLTKMD
ncbi:LuxR C-terminal-related transcriptional regulator [Brevundimonas vesicularis]|uniref:LuxR C-terminal-related transcriptional regulator n=1 Tax=Brevundimonas vesicularis TaxID=41276 RepID=UPI0038D36282